MMHCGVQGMAPCAYVMPQMIVNRIIFYQLESDASGPMQDKALSAQRSLSIF